MRNVLVSSLVLLAALGAWPSGALADPDRSTDAEGPGTVIGGFFRELVGYLKRSDKVDVGDMAPDFELMPLRFYDFGLDTGDDEEQSSADLYRGVRLSAFRHVKPVALIFGSYT